MADPNLIENYLVRLGLTYQEVAEHTWFINDADSGVENIIVSHEDPVVVLRAKAMDIPSKSTCEFYEELLRLNGSDLVHGAYALDGESVILVNTLLAETIDLEEFQASIDAISLALAQHYQVLSKYRSRKAGPS